MRINPFAATNIAYSDKIEEQLVFAKIMELVPTFNKVLAACGDHREALLNLLRMVSLRIVIWYYF